jgi:hypothetical protein
MSQVEIIKFGVVYNEGARGNAGGAPQNDKVWGIARIDGKLCTFNGRRNDKLSFKTRYNSEMDVCLSKWAEKTGGRTDGGDIYTELKGPMIKMVAPTIDALLVKGFYSKMARGMLNTQH